MDRPLCDTNQPPCDTNQPPCELERIVLDYRTNRPGVPCVIHLNEIGQMTYCDAEGAVRGAMHHTAFLTGARSRGAIIDYAPPHKSEPCFRFPASQPDPKEWKPGDLLPFYYNQTACDLPTLGCSVICSAIPSLVNGHFAGWHGLIIIAAWAAPTIEETTS